METYEDPIIEVESFAMTPELGHRPPHTSKVPVHSGDISEEEDL